MQSSFPCIGTSWQPLSMFDIVLAQLGMIHQRTSNKFVEIVDVADRYFIKAHAKKKKKIKEAAVPNMPFCKIS